VDRAVGPRSVAGEQRPFEFSIAPDSLIDEENLDEED
jgi:hypothetical protein